MLRNLILSIIIFGFINSVTAEISVKSFRKLETDLDARVNEPQKDQNGDWCAIIKVVTSQTGFYFDGGQLAITKTVPKHGEIWLYVPWGLKRLTISHDKLGILRDYALPLQTEKATVYELVLISGKVETIVTEEIASQWLLIHAEPEKAMIYIDNQFVKTGEYQAKLKSGKYDYRVEMPLYHTEAGKLEITDAKKELFVNLKPAYGNITVTSTPESGATVLIDGKEQTKTTPCQSENLASGEHTVQVIKEMYQPAYQKITVSDAKVTAVNFTMQPNFAELTITAPEANIYVNNQQKATGTWKGRVSAGVYSIEARRDKYRTAKQDIDLTMGDVKSINLQPSPIFGSLDIMTTPAGATITINGKDYGTTPNTVNKLLIGDYKVQLTKSGYTTVNKAISVTDGKNSELVETLSNGKFVTINSTPNGVNLYIDGDFIGITPFTGNLTFGNHALRIESNGKKSEKKITISQIGEETNFSLNFGTLQITDIDGNIYHSIKIGEQTWMVENLRTTHYRNGDLIPNETDNRKWSTLTTGAYCDYENNNSNSNEYGKLYNWYAVNDNRNIAPEGWHIPSDDEWTKLTDFLGGEIVAAKKLKDINWKSQDISTINKKEFSALPGGYRGNNGDFNYLNIAGSWWTASKANDYSACCRHMDYASTSVNSSQYLKIFGFSVRCIKD